MAGSITFHHCLGEPLPQRVVIVRSLPGLGDLLCIVPALRALRTALPTAQITLIGLSSAQPVVQRFHHYLNDWLEFPGWVDIPEVTLVPEKSVAFLAQVQRLDIDLVLQMHGNGSAINSFALLLGARLTAGFYPSGQGCPDGDRFLPYPEQESEIWRHLRLLEFLGVPLQGDHLEFPLHPADWDELAAIAACYPIKPKTYICIHPGASTAERRWLPHQFAMVADILAAQGFQIVLTGTAAEAGLTQQVAHAMRFPAVDLAGQTSLGAIAALFKQSRLLICNDTGVSHLAAALQVKSVVIFSNSDMQRWTPLDRRRHRAVNGRFNAEFGIRNAEFQPPVATVVAQAIDLLQEVSYAS